MADSNVNEPNTQEETPAGEGEAPVPSTAGAVHESRPWQWGSRWDEWHWGPQWRGRDWRWSQWSEAEWASYRATWFGDDAPTFQGSQPDRPGEGANSAGQGAVDVASATTAAELPTTSAAVSTSRFSTLTPAASTSSPSDDPWAEAARRLITSTTPGRDREREATRPPAEEGVSASVATATAPPASSRQWQPQSWSWSNGSWGPGGATGGGYRGDFSDPPSWPGWTYRRQWTLAIRRWDKLSDVQMGNKVNSPSSQFDSAFDRSPHEKSKTLMDQGRRPLAGVHEQDVLHSGDDQDDVRAPGLGRARPEVHTVGPPKLSGKRPSSSRPVSSSAACEPCQPVRLLDGVSGMWGSTVLRLQQRPRPCRREGPGFRPSPPTRRLLRTLLWDGLCQRRPPALRQHPVRPRVPSRRS